MLSSEQIMRCRTIIFLTCLLLLPSVAMATTWAQPPGTGLHGQSPSELSTAWWQWAQSRPDEVNPLRDRTGEHCAVGQQGKIWFLAGGFGSTKIKRTCTIPANKALFFPLINMAYWRPQDGKGFTCEGTKANAAINNHSAIDLFAELDGVPLTDLRRYRVSTKQCFNIFERVPGKYHPYNAYPSASDGYWLLLRPLSPGRHVLKFGGRYNRSSSSFGRMLQDIEYELIVR